MSRMHLREIIGKPLTGEWGNEDLTGTGVPVLRTTNFTNDGIISFDNVVTRDISPNRLNDKWLKHGDIIIEKSGGSDRQPVGRVVYYVGENNAYTFNNFTSALRVQDQSHWNPKFVFYALFYNYAIGGTRKYENKTTGLHNLKLNLFVDKFAINWISVSEQNRIVAVIDAITHLISLRQRQAEKLDELVKARFVEMFGDLAAPNCKWKTIKIVEACENENDIKCGPFGTQLSKNEYQETGVAVWEIPQINSGFQMVPTHFLTAEKAEALRDYSIVPGDIAMSRKGNVGRCAVFPESLEAGIIHSDVLRIRVNHEIVSAIFLMYQLHFSEAVKHQIAIVSLGAIMAGINVTKLKKIRIHIPPLPLQNAFATFVHEVDREKEHIQRSAALLETLKRSLMQQYFG